MDDEKQIIKKYINTPFAYARAQKGLTLLQQNIMVKVVEHLQGYISKYYMNPALRDSDESPKPLMTCEDRDNLPPIRVELSELGVSSNSYSRVRETLKEILNVQIEKNTFDKEGKPIKRLVQIFSKIDTPVTDKGTRVKMRVNDDDEDLSDVKVDRTRGYIDIYLNKDMVFEMFDMNLGYVSHPEDIARIGKVDNMPLMYYLIRHKMKNFRLSKVQVSPNDIREYLGLIKRDAGGNITEVKYPKYSMFKTRIIKTALDDIKRVCDAGQIDFYFEMKEIRPRGKSRGEPTYIEFVKVAQPKKVKEEHRKASEKRLHKTMLDQYPMIDSKRLMAFFKSVPNDLWNDFKTYAYNGVPKAVEQPHRWNGTTENFVFYIMDQWIKQRQPKVEIEQELPLFANTEVIKPGEKEWKAFLESYKGVFLPYVQPFAVHAYDGKTLVFRATRTQREAFENFSPIDIEHEVAAFKSALKQAFGCAVRISYYQTED